jgi:putative ABC transport system ATP-binding protein
MHIMAGLDRPTGGSVVLDGVEITGLSDKKLTLLRREKIGLRLPGSSTSCRC